MNASTASEYTRATAIEPQNEKEATLAASLSFFSPRSLEIRLPPPTPNRLEIHAIRKTRVKEIDEAAVCSGLFAIPIKKVSARL